jgi:ribonucleoside-diphosphate reductase beta chain
MNIQETSPSNFSVATNYLERNAFLDMAGRVTVQRYEEHRYPIVARYVDTQKGAFWVPEEINVTKDKTDFKMANEATRHIFTSNLLRQTALDSIQGRSPVECFTPVCSIPELEALMLWWSAFEQIHSKSYSHLIRNIYNVPTQEFNKIHDTEEIIHMAAAVGVHYDHLYELNCKKTLLATNPSLKTVRDYLYVSEEDHIDAIWMALHASYALEAIRFMVSFATSLIMAENKIFIGNGTIITLILQDELLHTAWTAHLINRIPRDDARFAAAKERCASRVWDLYMQVIEEEKRWPDYLFKYGTVVGMSAQSMRDFVDHTAQFRLKEIGLKYDAGIKYPPFPWFNKHLDSSKKQTALQENESSSYSVNSMTEVVNYEELPDL